MSHASLVYGPQIYNNSLAQVQIFTGTLHSFPVIIKSQLHSTFFQANAAIKEAMCQVSLDHPNICRVFDCYLEPLDGQSCKSILVIEQMDRDIMREIDDRKQTGAYWDEATLLRFLWNLVSALSYAQSKGVTHRDIKPQNLFLSIDKATIKIGDFGVSSRAFDISSGSEEFAGSPFFLSPELKTIYLRTMTTGKMEAVRDSYIKGDVYSLGVTLLFMALLRQPAELWDLNNLASNSEAVLENLRGYPQLQHMLRWMLTIEPENRPDFLTLEQHLNRLQQPQSIIPEDSPKPDPVADKKTAETSSQCCYCLQSLTSIWSYFQSPLLLGCGHFFHSQSCFKAFVSATIAQISPPKYLCPQCSSSIPPEFLEFHIGLEQLTKMLSDSRYVCNHCKSFVRCEARGCGHFFCKACYEETTTCEACPREESLLSTFNSFIQNE